MRINLKSTSLILRIWILTLVISTKFFELPFSSGIWISNSLSSMTIFLLISRYKSNILKLDENVITRLTRITLTACFTFSYLAFFPFLKLFEIQVRKREAAKVDLERFDFKSQYKLEV